MCGIAGILSSGERPVDPWRIQRMCDIQAHRGPDDAGYAFFQHGEGERREGGSWCSLVDTEFRHLNEHLAVFQSEYGREELACYQFDLGLGHRRLAVIDLTHHGHQPMCTSDRRLWVVANGEIYNFRELRSDLEAKGHIFRTCTDTEVLLHLWEEEGIQCLGRLNGMFAFALYDRVKGILTLARDRFGVKPLYYAQARGQLVFASEPKAILASGLIQPEIDPGALAQYLTFQNIFDARTLFRGIHVLPAGTYLQLGLESSAAPPKPTPYHHGFASSCVESEVSDSDVAECFAAAVRRQLVSDVPVGAFLSGGMDSGSIVAVAARSIPRLTTFTGGFDLTNVSGIEQGFDERPMAEALSYLFQTEHYAVVLHAGDMPAAMEKISWHVDDPRVGMCHQNWYVAKLASRFVKVCLSGAGGDELFGGYPWRYRNGISAIDTSDFDERYFRYWHRLLPPERLSALVQDWLRIHLKEAREAFQSVVSTTPTPSRGMDVASGLLQRALHFEFKTFLQGYLTIEDRISMAHGLESRVPFLDNDLADLAWRIPPRQKVDLDTICSNGDADHLESADGKRILRCAMEEFLPARFTRQKKRGFSSPDDNWYRGPSMNYVKEILLDTRTRGRSWFDQQTLGRILQEHFAAQQNHRLLIWSLLSIEWLQRHFIDKPVSAADG